MGALLRLFSKVQIFQKYSKKSWCNWFPERITWIFFLKQLSFYLKKKKHEEITALHCSIHHSWMRCWKSLLDWEVFSPTVAIPIYILNITYSSPSGESAALNRPTKEWLKIWAQTLAGKGIYRRQTLAMHLGKLSQSKERYLWYECLESPTQPQVWLKGMLS